MATPFDGRSAHNQSPKSLSDIADSASSVTCMQAAAPKPKTVRRAHPGQGVPTWRASKWPNQRSCVENGERGLGRDHLYSIAALTDSAKNVVERYRYDTYGNRTVLAPDGVTVRTVSSYGQQIGFTGRYLDRESGLWHFRARYYSGTLGRFIGRDPLRYVDGYQMYMAYFAPNGRDSFGFDDQGGIPIPKFDDKMTKEEAEKIEKKGCIGQCCYIIKSKSTKKSPIDGTGGPQSDSDVKCFKTQKEMEEHECECGHLKYMFIHQCVIEKGEDSPQGFRITFPCKLHKCHPGSFPDILPTTRLSFV